MNAALFDAPELDGQGTLFGGLTMTADELDELCGQAVELDPRADELDRHERLGRGEAIFGVPGSCASCGHGRIRHSHTNRNLPCELDGCHCSSFAPWIDLGE